MHRELREDQNPQASQVDNSLARPASDIRPMESIRYPHSFPAAILPFSFASPQQCLIQELEATSQGIVLDETTTNQARTI